MPMPRRSATRPLSTIVALATLTLALAGCEDDDGEPARDANPGLPAFVSLTPEVTGDGWQTSTPAAEGLDSQVLMAVMEDIRNGAFPGVDALIVVRNQRLLAEGYFNGFGRESLHDLRSTGKSFTAALAGIAMDRGLLSIGDTVAQHIPGFERHQNMDERKRAITLRDLLHMRSGLDCNDWDAASPGQEERMYDSRDWIGFVLDLPMTAAPDSRSSYCTGGVVLLGHILSIRSGMALDDFAQTWLFDPLAIRESSWRRSPDGRATGGGGLRLRPRDAAKLGALFVAEGEWYGSRVVPEEWVLATRERVADLGGDGYGYLWWKRRFAHRGSLIESSFTSGNGGNFIFTFPAAELVITLTGSNYNFRRAELPYHIVPRVLEALP